MSLPRRLLTLAVLLLAAATLGGVFAVAQAQEAEGAINGLTLSSDTPGTLTVSWHTPSPAPSDYRVRWAQAESDYPSWKDDNETDRGNEYPAGDATSLTLSGLSEETEFKVQVRARYNDGAHKDKPWSGPWTEEVRGQPSEESAGSGVKGATDDPSAPAAPNLSGTAVTPEGQVLLAWLDPSDDSITGYQVLRGPDADNLVVIEEDTGSSGTSYTDTSPPAGRTHTYAVKARNAAGLSPPSNTVTATVPEPEEDEELITASHTSADQTLVSNLGQTVGSFNVTAMDTATASQQFTTGNNPTGYHLTELDLYLRKFEAPIPVPVITIQGERDGYADGAVLYTFNTSSAVTNTSYQLYTLTTDQRTRLQPNTNYWVHVAGVGSNELALQTTASDDEDADSQPLWQIGDALLWREFQQAWTPQIAILRLEIRGHEADEPQEISEAADGDLPADTTTTGLLVVDGAGVTGRVYTLGGRPFNTPPDVDWYAVDLLPNIYYQFDVVPTDQWRHLLKIHNSEGTELRSSAIKAVGTGYYQYPQRVNTLAFSKDAAGTYYVSIEPPLGTEELPDRKYTLTARSDDYPADKTTTAAVPVDGTLRYYESFQNYLMRTKSDPDDTATDDVDWIRVALRGNVPYRFVYDVACRHEGIIEGVYTSAGTLVANSGASISRRTDGTCTDLTMPFTPPAPGDYFVAVTARGSDFPGASQGRAPFQGVYGTLSVVDTTAPPRSSAKGGPLARGERKMGATLTADIGGITDDDGLTDPTFTYQWQRVDGGTPADISGATSVTYTLTDDDVGKRIQLQVQFTDDDNNQETRTGPATSLVVSAPRFLVGNFGQTGAEGRVLRNVSTGFVAGAHPLGYTIDDIGIWRNTNLSVSSGLGEFRLYTSTSHSSPRERRPDDRIMTVSGPDGISGRRLTFNAPSRVKLDPSSTYHVVLTTSTGETIGCDSVSGGGEDSSSLAGFDIIDRYQGYPNPSAGFRDDRSCRFQIRGFELASSKFVQSVEFTSSPVLAGMYATGEVMEVTATLSEAVAFVGPPPVLLLQIGDNQREMTYEASASTATSWVFRYTVAAGDRDDDGVPLERNALRGYADADLSHRGIGDDEARHVNAAPRVVSRGVTSRPVAPNWYGPGEQIQFTVGFSLAVTVVGDPQLEFNVTTPGPQNELASYLSGSGTRELVFSYTVGTGDDDSDGIYWSSNSLRLDSDDAITSVYNSLEPVLDHSALGTRSSHRIDQNPRAVSQQVTSDPTHGTNSDTYGAGDEITFEVVFNQTVIVTGGPRLRFNISSGSGDEYASYVSGSGTDTLVFSYTVLAADADTDGIYRYNNPLDYPDTATDSIVGEDNSLPAENEGIGRSGAISSHKVDGSITN